jgi:hypothetical protein
MNLERVFESILRIYPKSFHDRFGEELKLGFQDEINAKPSKLEIAKLLGDTITSAIWERLQATKWIYWLLAISTAVYLLVSSVTLFFPALSDPIYAVWKIFYVYICVSIPLVFLMRLERAPSRLEWLGMIIVANPMFFFWIDSNSLDLMFWFNFLTPLGFLLFAASYQWTRVMSLQVRLLKFGLALMALITIINNLIGNGHIAKLNAWQSLALQQVSAVFGLISIIIVIFTLIWKPKNAIALS